MANKQTMFEIVDDDPNFDYEYYDNNDFGDYMEEADKRGELFRAAELGTSDAFETFRKAKEILAAKRAKERETAVHTCRYPLRPAATEELWVAEEPEAKYV